MMHDLTDVPIERLEADIAALCADISRSTQRWLAMVAEFDRRGGARRWGFRGTAEWLAWHCGLSDRAAREHVRVARGLVTRPLVRAAFATGDLSYSKVRALTRAPDAEDEQALLDLATRTSAGDLERTVQALRRQPSADVDVARAAHARRYVHWSWEADGSLSVRARLTAEDGAAFIDAVERGAAELHPPPEPAPASPPDGAPHVAFARPPLGARRADALAEITRSGAPRVQVVLHVDEAALACTATEPEDRAGETCALEAGPAVPSETARRLSCDSDLVVAHDAGDDGDVARPPDYGRRRRTVPPPLRAALERRDGCCRFPGCAQRHDLHAHHVRHWAHGGPTDRENLVLLCRFHHRLVHEDGFTVCADEAERFSFHRPDGLLVPHTGPPPPREARPRPRSSPPVPQAPEQVAA
jgi:hypothetical protein